MHTITAPLRTLLLTAAAVVLALAVNVGYGLLLWQFQRVLFPTTRPQHHSGAPYCILGIFLMAVSAILSARWAASRPDSNPSRIGLAVGAGLGVVVIAAMAAQGRFDFWLLPNAVLAMVGGWLGCKFVNIK